MAITILNEWQYTEGSFTSDLESIFSKLNLYYKAPITNLSYSTVKILNPDTFEQITFRGIEIDDDGVSKFYLLTGDQFFKYWYYSLENINYSGVEDMPQWKTAHGLDFYYLPFEQDQQITITTYNSSDVVIDTLAIDVHLTALGQKVPSKYGFNMFEYFTAQHLQSLKWSNNTFNEIILHWETSTKKAQIKNLTTGKTIHDSTSPLGGTGTFGLYFAKKIQDIYPSSEPETFHKEGDTTDTDDIDIDAGNFAAGEVEKVSLCLDKTIYSDDNGADNRVTLAMEYGVNVDGDGAVGALTITADAAFTLNNCIDASVISQDVNLTAGISIKNKHVISFELRKTTSTNSFTLEVFGGTIEFITSSTATTITYDSDTIFTLAAELTNTNLITVSIDRDGYNVSTTVTNSGIGGGTDTQETILTNDNGIIISQLVNNDYDRIGNIKIMQDGLNTHWWKCDSVVGGDIPDEGIGIADTVTSTQQKDGNTNCVCLELTPTSRHDTLAADVKAYLDLTTSHGGTGHVFIDNIKMLGTFTPEYDVSILAEGNNKIEFKLFQNAGLDYDFNKVINIHYDPTGRYTNLLFNHPHLGYVSFPFEGLEIEGLSTSQGEELTLFQTTMVNVSVLTELLSIKSNKILTISAQVDKEYWDIVKEIYNARKAFLYVGETGAIDSEENWISCQVAGTPNINENVNKTSALFTIELKLPEELNNKL